MVTKPTAKDLSIAVEEISIQAGEVKPLTYQCSDERATVTFVVEDENVVSVQDGYIYAKQIGATVLRATATRGEDRAVTTTKIHVVENENMPITNLPSKVDLYLLDKEIESARADGFDNQKEFDSYKDYSVTLEGNTVKVSNNTILANKLGTTLITFTSQNQKQTVEVNVLSISPTLKLPDEITLSKNETYEISPKISPIYYTGQAKVTLQEEGHILTITDLSIKAEQSGTSEIKVYLNETLIKTIKVTVEYEDEIVLTFSSNADMIGNTIYTKDDILMFKTNILNEEPKLYTTEGKISKELTTIILKDFTNATITITYPSLNLSVEFVVIKV